MKKAERQRIDAFELWCWRRLLRVPWTARRPNKSILKEISPGCSLEGLILKLKLQYFGHLTQRVDSLEQTDAGRNFGAGGEGDDRGWDGWMATWTWWTCVWVNSGSWWWTGRPDVLRFLGSRRVRHDWTTELNWTEPRKYKMVEAGGKQYHFLSQDLSLPKCDSRKPQRPRWGPELLLFLRKTTSRSIKVCIFTRAL